MLCLQNHREKLFNRLQIKTGRLQTGFFCPRPNLYFSAMTKKQLVVVYAVVVFMMVWGIDLINLLKFGRSFSWQSAFSVFTASQLIYITATLLLTRWVFGRFNLSRKYGWLLGGVAGLVLCFMLLRFLLEEVLSPALTGYHNYPKGVSPVFYALDNIYYSLIYIVLGLLIYLLDSQIASQKRAAVLLQKTREAELQFLRSQINPHFLFNTLNNIYALVYEKSPGAPEAVLKLADLMRYLLYEQKEKVPLIREWEYVHNFINLQAMRFPQQLPVEFTLEGVPEKHEIIPHLLISFVENAFKHGDFKDPSAPLVIRLQCNGREIRFETKNKIAHFDKDKNGGVGLENIKRRLDLLYPGRYQLNIKNSGTDYSSLLTLNTTSA